MAMLNQRVEDSRVAVDDLLYIGSIKTYYFWYGDDNPWMQRFPQNCQSLAVRIQNELAWLL